MKQLFGKTLASLLALSLLWSLAVPALASPALGDDLTASDTLLNRQTQLSTNVFWSSAYSDYRTENLITYTPNYQVTPVITYGSVLTERNTVSAMARQLEAGGYRVVGGINGDFYNVNNGLPIGLVVAGGRLRSTDGGYHAIGFRADGTAILGKPGLRITADLGYQTVSGGTEAAGEPLSEDGGTPADVPALPEAGRTPEDTPEIGLGTETFPLLPEEAPAAPAAVEAVKVLRPVIAVNKARTNAGIYLYTYDFNATHTTGCTQPGVDLLCTIREGELSIGGSLTVTVDQVLPEARTATAIGPQQVVLTANLQADPYLVDALRNTPVGTTVTLSVSAANEGWNDVQYAVGALYSLVENGAVAGGLEKGAAPRTAVGQGADGSVIFYTIDGRRSGHSIGATMTQVAQRMVELGCVTALCLDGGGSTTLSITRPAERTARTLNRPSDGAERSVSNQIFLVASGEPTGELDHFYVSTDHDYVLAGSTTSISAAAVDTNFIPMDWGYELFAAAGLLEGNVLTTPPEGGDITVTALSGEHSGTVTIHAVVTPDDVAIRNEKGDILEKLAVPLDSVTQLVGSAAYLRRSLKADPAAFTWTVEGDIGTVDEQGRFTAQNPGEGTLTISAGGRSASIPVKVSGGTLLTAEDFEGTTTVLRGSGEGCDFSLSHDLAFVRMGRGSGRLDYDLGEEGRALWTAVTQPAVLEAPYTDLNLWVYGDSSGNTLSLRYGQGEEMRTVPLTVLDFTGWKQVTLTGLPNPCTLLGLEVTGQGSGTVYLDQITASYDGIVDGEAPEIAAALDSELWQVTASVRDAVDGLLPAESVSVTLNGKPFGVYDPASGTVLVSLPGPGESQEAGRVTITAKDASGNIGRASVDLPASDTAHQFNDIDDYWAADYVDFLRTAGITAGYDDGTFRPNENITRAQFAVMLYRYLGLETEETADLSLPFADEIPDYAKTAAAALYARGILTGSEGADGRLYFNPYSSLTRAQAAAMIGRTQEKGYSLAELSFTDKDSIPGYALFYIQTMAAQQVINGYDDGTFRPHANITRGQMAKILYNLM